MCFEILLCKLILQIFSLFFCPYRYWFCNCSLKFPEVLSAKPGLKFIFQLLSKILILLFYLFIFFIFHLGFLSLGDFVNIANPVPEPACGSAGPAYSGLSRLYLLHFFSFKILCHGYRFAEKWRELVLGPQNTNSENQPNWTTCFSYWDFTITLMTATCSFNIRSSKDL